MANNRTTFRHVLRSISLSASLKDLSKAISIGNLCVGVVVVPLVAVNNFESRGECKRGGH